MERLKSKDRQHSPINSLDNKSVLGGMMIESSIHSKKLHKLAKKAASTCVGGVLPSNAFFEAFDGLKKPFKIQAPSKTSSAVESMHVCDEEIDNACIESANICAQVGQNDQDAISTIAHLLDIGKFDMLEKPKTEKKWGKLSLAVKEKTVAMAAVQTKKPVETVDPTDLLLFYYSKHRNPIWSAFSHILAC
jgi:hypothetical protein